MKILMCKPTYYDIDYEINAWMSKANKANHLKAAKQWRQLYDLIGQCGAEILLIEPQKGWPDMVFTANAGLAKGGQVFLSEFRHPERQGEKHYFKQWFIKEGYDILDPDLANQQACFEGEGDALLSNGNLFAGFGIRSDKAFYANVAATFQVDIVYCELIDPYFYHLDTCFSPLDGSVGIWWPKAFTDSTQKSMQDRMELLAVPDEEAKLFACNAVVIGKQVILPAGCPQTTALLEQRGFKVYSCEMSEYIKSGGACKCLTMII